MTGITSFAVAGLFECISRILQAFANGALGGLRPMFNGLPRFSRGFLDGLASLLHWTLILSAQNERSAN
jgi:hypothetical protein